MILIITEDNDYSTNKVIDWLSYFDIPFIRVNDTDEISIDSLVIGGNKPFEIQFSRKGIKPIYLKNIKAIWYRRGFLNLSKPISLDSITDGDIKENIYNHLYKEMIAINDYIDFCISQKPHVNTFKKKNVNKLIVLKVANEIGLKTPKTIITSKISDIKKIISAQDVITKSIQENLTLDIHNIPYATFTENILQVNNFGSDDIFHTLIQHNIIKQFELRIFYLNGKTSSMAIFSQSSEQTSIDFRIYNKSKPNRRVPYKLPNEIHQKISILMNRLQLESGSIDMIVSTENEYIFLEVNPIGQFDMVSKPCNYYLPKSIASTLKAYSNG